MKVSDFDYELPRERVAQEPAPRREDSRLLVLHRGTGEILHRSFRDLPEFLDAGDVLVLNDTRVIPARLWGRKASGGRVELLLTEHAGGAEWRALLHASRPPPVGSTVDVDPTLRVVLVGRHAGFWTVRLETPAGEDPHDALQRLGHLPLPPYIRREPDDPRHTLDRERYQTVYARRDGAVAAPTAGLHFTPRLLRDLERRGVARVTLTLHVGAGTFLPVRGETVEEHRIPSEVFDLPERTAAALRDARRRGARVVAVGTTVVRTLESRATDSGEVLPGGGRCDLFIYPGFRFRVVDAMITNFHLPRSTLLMLVSAFAGREAVLAAYREAVEAGYRFYSYGDAMLIAARAGRRAERSTA